MKLNTNITTETYESNFGFRIDIVKDITNDEYSIWLYHKDYGVKEYCYGAKLSDAKASDLDIDEIGEYLVYDNYVSTYAKAHMSEDLYTKLFL